MNTATDLATIAELFTAPDFGCSATLNYPPSPSWGTCGDDYMTARKAHDAACAALRARAVEAVKGCVVDHDSENGGYDGDYWTCYYAIALIQTVNGPRFARIQTRTVDDRIQNGHTDHCNLPKDATPEVLTAATVYTKEVDARRYRAKQLKDAYDYCGSVQVKTGCLVLVTKGRKCPVGTVGIVAGVFDGEYGAQARVTLVYPDGQTNPKDKERTWYVPVANCEVLLSTADAQPNWRLPVLPEAVAAVATGELAWRWSDRSEGACATVSDAHGVVWECPNCSQPNGVRVSACPARLNRVQDGWRAVSDRLRTDALAALVAAACDGGAEGPIKMDETTPHDFASIMDALEAGREDLCHALQEFPAVPTDDGMREAMYAATKGIIVANLGSVYAPPVAAKRKRAARKAKTEKTAEAVAA